MLSEQEKREMKEDAKSATIREDFERLRRASRLDPNQPMDLDRLVNWLSVMNRCFPLPPPREPADYPNARL